jgi:para-aminobenzoate synthetase component 1
VKKKAAGFTIEDSKAFKIKMLNWSSRFNIFCFLDNSNYHFEQPAFEYLLAAGCMRSVTLSHKEDLADLQSFSEKNPGWLFGHFGYDVLNGNASLYCDNENEVCFEDGFFFIPEIMIRFKDDQLIIEASDHDPAKIFAEINACDPLIRPSLPADTDFTEGITKAEYKSILADLKKHILRGDCYEINFCQHFFSKNTAIDPLHLYYKLSVISPNPFAAFYKLNDKYCLCASPERFLKKTGNTLISQPIKGTSKRDLSDLKKDEANKNYLIHSSKEKSENVMIVDLVRNDLSKICKEGSVHVKELFGIYSFPQVHQLISTVEGEVLPGTAWTDIIKACFPMGSMTGAPKKKVMELIARYEQFPRGLFSGSIGYIDPSGDFDFNVIIRSLLYDETKKIISFKVGGGITFYSDADREYEECLMKAEAIKKILKDL